MSRWLALVWLLLLSPVAAAETAPLVVLLAPQTGADADLGRRLSRAAQLELPPAEVLRFRIIDAADDPAGAYREAVEIGASAVLGPVHSWRVREVLGVRDASDPPLFLLSSVDGVENSAARVARLRTSPADQSEALAGILLATTEIRDVAVLAPDDAYGEESMLAFVASMQQWGGRIDRVARYPAADPDVSEALEWLVGQRRAELVTPTDPWRTPPRWRTTRETGLRTRPQALFIPDYADQVALLLPYLSFHRWMEGGHADVFLLGLSGWGGAEIEWVSELAAGAWMTSAFRADDLRTVPDAFTLEFGVRFGEEPTELDAQVYDAAQFVFRAVLGAGPEGTWVHALSLRHAGVCGDMWLGADGGVERDLSLWQLDGAGRPYLIGPIERGRP